MDNTLRLAAGEKLRPAQEGNDEIAKLDLFFHSMAESLEEAAHKERAIVDNAADIICSIDEHGVFTTLNPASAKVWDYSPEELLGSRLIRIVVSEDAPKTAQNLKQVASEGTELSFENRINRKDGAIVHMLWSAHWVAKEKSLFCVAHDITHRKVVEELKKEFVAMVSHDLRTPLTSILSSLELISTGSFGALSAPGQKIVEDSESELNRLIQLINDLLDIARMEAGKWQFNFAPNLVSDILERSLRAVAGVSKHRGIAVVVPETEIEVVADSERIVQVMVNLLSNAIKFSPAGSEVRVSVDTVDDDWVEIRVSDAGPGIPVEYRESIFQRFEQLTPETSLQNSGDRVGSGLGLAICKTIIEGHGGKLGVEGSEGGGSSFYFRIHAV